MGDLIINIAIISPQLYPFITGGVEIFNYYFIKELAKKGHKVWVFTFNDYDWKNKNVTNIKLCKRMLISVNLSITLNIILNLKKLKQQIDIIHVPYTSNNFIAYPLILQNKLFGVPYIVTIHGGGMYNWKPKIPHELFFKYANAIIAVSSAIKREYETRIDRKIIMIPPMIPFVECHTLKMNLKKKYGFGNNDLIILSLGSIKRIKGSDLLLDAFLNLGKEYVDVNNLKLLYVGEGIMRKDLERRINKQNLGQYVQFLGKIPYEKVHEMYKLADIFIMSSLFEAFPITLAEAMFNGLPIIATNTTGIDARIRHRKNGLLFEKGNTIDLKNKIMELVDDIDLAKRLGKSAKDDFYKGNTFDNVISDHIKFYEEVLGR